MKLYATVTSERASKGQGGNRFLETVYTVGDAESPEQFAIVNLTRTEGNVSHTNVDGYTLTVVCDDNVLVLRSDGAVLLDTRKGKKQKGKNYCKHADDDICKDCIPF